jgi:4-hydroxy-L-threonine phosphate dehydrogenase PdxA
MAFADIIPNLSIERVVATAEGLLNVMRYFLPQEECKIVIAALNPHAGENGLYGNEEAVILEPAVKILQERGYKVIGPCPADTVFMRAVKGDVHGIVFLYHDQGNLAMKARYFGEATVIYTGIPSHLVSVGHGPAYGKAGKGTADATNMITSMGILLQLIKGEHK